MADPRLVAQSSTDLLAIVWPRIRSVWLHVAANQRAAAERTAGIPYAQSAGWWRAALVEGWQTRRPVVGSEVMHVRIWIPQGHRLGCAGLTALDPSLPGADEDELRACLACALECLTPQASGRLTVEVRRRDGRVIARWSRPIRLGIPAPTSLRGA